MKRILCILSAVIMLCTALCSCGGKDEKADSVPTPSPLATETPSDNPVANKHLGIPEYGMNESVQIDTKRGKGSIKIKGIKEIDDSVIKKVLESERVISIELEYANESREPYMYLYAYDFVVRDSKDTILRPYVVFEDGEKETNTIAPGEGPVTKQLIYGISNNENHIRMEFYDAQQELEPLFAYELDF